MRLMSWGLAMTLAAVGGTVASDLGSLYLFEMRFLQPGILELRSSGGASWSSMRLGCSAPPCIVAIHDRGGESVPSASDRAAAIARRGDLVIRENPDPRAAEFTCLARKCVISVIHPDGLPESVILNRGEQRELTKSVLLSALLRVSIEP